MKKNVLSVLLVFTFLICLMPMGALAAPYIDGKSLPQEDVTLDSVLPEIMDRSMPVAEESESVPVSDMIPEDISGDVPADAEAESPVGEEPESPAGELAAGEDLLQDEDYLPVEEDLPVVPEETPESIAAAKEVADQIESDGVVVLSEVQESDAPDSVAFLSEAVPVTVREGEVFYTQDGMTVYNNGGTVFCNEALVFNNGGIVFVNSGVVYNNAGTAYANGGTVYNNAGTVYDNGASVFGFEDNGSIFTSGASVFPDDAEEPVAEEEPAPIDRDDFFIEEDVAGEDALLDESIWGEDGYDLDQDVIDRDDFFVDEKAEADEDLFFDQDSMDWENADLLDEEMMDKDMFIEDDVPVEEENNEDYIFDQEIIERDEFFVEDDEEELQSENIAEDVLSDEDLLADGEVLDRDMLPVVPDDSEEEDDLPQEWMDRYAPVFDSYNMFLDGEEFNEVAMTDEGDYYLSVGETGVSYLCRDGGTPGYFFRDLDKDGVPELLITSSESEYYDGYLYDMFTLEDGQPVRVLASSDRIHYHLTEDDLILYEGSGGAETGLVGVYEFTGSRLELLVGIVMDNGEYYEIFGNSLIDVEEDGKDQVPITREEYEMLQETFEGGVLTLDTTPFAKVG